LNEALLLMVGRYAARSLLSRATIMPIYLT